MKTETDGPDLAERIASVIADAILVTDNGLVADACRKAMEMIRATTAPIEAELAELRAFAERFPKTADGVRIYLGMTIFFGGIGWMVDSICSGRIIIRRPYGGHPVECEFREVNPSQCLSTEAAMLAAKEGE